MVEQFMPPNIAENNRTSSRKLVEPNSWMSYRGRQIKSDIRERERGLLKPLPQSDCVNTQVLVIKKSNIRGFMLQMREINFTKMLQSIHQTNKQANKNKQKSQGGSQRGSASKVAITYCLKCPVFNNNY